MTSQINASAIDPNFPIAGQDNDSQGFRDNFSAIQTALEVASSEITAMQTNSAKLDTDNNFNGVGITNALTNQLYGKVYAESGISGSRDILFSNGEYQIATFSANGALNFREWPLVDGFAKIRIEIRSQTSPSTPYTINLLNSLGQLKVNDPILKTFSAPATAASSKIIEVWTADKGATVFVRYLGEFTV